VPFLFPIPEALLTAKIYGVSSELEHPKFTLLGFLGLKELMISLPFLIVF